MFLKSIKDNILEWFHYDLYYKNIKVIVDRKTIGDYDFIKKDLKESLLKIIESSPQCKKNHELIKKYPIEFQENIEDSKKITFYLQKVYSLDEVINYLERLMGHYADKLSTRLNTMITVFPSDLILFRNQLVDYSKLDIELKNLIFRSKHPNFSSYWAKICHIDKVYFKKTSSYLYHIYFKVYKSDFPHNNELPSNRVPHQKIDDKIYYKVMNVYDSSLYYIHKEKE